MRARKTILGGLIVVMLLGLVGCGGDNDNEVLGGKKDADLVISDEDPRLDPNKFEIELNKEVTLTVFNDGARVHNVTIPGMEIDVDIPAKQSAQIKIPAVSAAPRDGFFLLYCKYHQVEGEAGRLDISR